MQTMIYWDVIKIWVSNKETERLPSKTCQQACNGSQNVNKKRERERLSDIMCPKQDGQMSKSKLIVQERLN